MGDKIKNMMNKMQMKGLIPFFPCAICHKKMATYDRCREHMVEEHDRILKEYKDLNDYRKAVKEGKEKDLTDGRGLLHD